MEKIIEIQEEFEGLISELEKLKTVNQLTSENTANTTKVISEISSFVGSVNTFKLSVIKDYEGKRTNFEDALETLNLSFKKIDKNTSQQSKKIATLLDDTKKSVNQEVEDLKVKIKSTTEDYIDSLKGVNAAIKKNIELFTENTANSIGEREANLVSKTTNIDKKIDLIRYDLKKMKEENEMAFSQIVNSVEQKLRNLNRLLENGLESIRLNQATDLNKIREENEVAFSQISNSIEQKLRNLNVQIENGLESINLKQSENLKDVKDKLEKQQKVISNLTFVEIKKNREEVKTSRIIMIVLIIILIGIMIYVAIK